MSEIVPGVCTPVFIYLLFSFSALFLVLINADNRDAGMMGFLIFATMALFTSLMSIVCNMGFVYVSWLICGGSLFATAFLVNSPFVGKVDLLAGAGEVVKVTVDLIWEVYDAIKGALR